MIWPPVYNLVIPMPVVTLAVGYKQPNRHVRRRAIYGKGNRKYREWGLYGKA